MYLIAYDIENDKVRTKFSKFLTRYGIRLQYSVYRIENSPRVLENIKADINCKFSKLFGHGDSVLIFDVSDDGCVAKFGYPKEEEGDLIIN